MFSTMLLLSKFHRHKAEPFQNLLDGHILSISVAGRLHIMKGTGVIPFRRKGEIEGWK